MAVHDIFWCDVLRKQTFRAKTVCGKAVAFQMYGHTIRQSIRIWESNTPCAAYKRGFAVQCTLCSIQIRRSSFYFRSTKAMTGAVCQDICRIRDADSREMTRCTEKTAHLRTCTIQYRRDFLDRKFLRK